MNDSGRWMLLSLGALWMAGPSGAATYTLANREETRIEEAHPSVTLEVAGPGRVEISDAERGWRVSFGWIEPRRTYPEGSALSLSVTGGVVARGEGEFAVRIAARIETLAGDGTRESNERLWRSTSRPEILLGPDADPGEALGEISMSEHPEIRIVLEVEGGVLALVAAWTFRREETSSTVGEAESSNPADFSGTWSTRFGELVLAQDGNRVTGQYSDPPGTIEGDVTGDTLRFHWTQPGNRRKGAGRFVLGADGRLAGSWNSVEDPDAPGEGAWTGERRPGAGGDRVGEARANLPGAQVLPGGSISGSVLATPEFDSPEPATGTPRGALQAGQRRVKEGETAQLPVYLIGAGEVSNMNLEIRYDSSIVQVAGEVAAGGVLDGVLFEANTAESGIVRIAFASRRGVSGAGIVATIPFRAVGLAGRETWIAVTLSAAGGPDRRIPEIDVVHGRIRIAGGEGARPGDVDGDGSLTERDARAALRMSVRKTPERSITDMDADGRATSNDAALILESAVGK